MKKFKYTVLGKVLVGALGLLAVAYSELSFAQGTIEALKVC